MKSSTNLPCLTGTPTFHFRIPQRGRPDFPGLGGASLAEQELRRRDRPIDRRLHLAAAPASHVIGGGGGAGTHFEVHFFHAIGDIVGDDYFCYLDDRRATTSSSKKELAIGAIRCFKAIKPPLSYLGRGCFHKSEARGAGASVRKACRPRFILITTCCLCPVLFMAIRYAGLTGKSVLFCPESPNGPPLRIATIFVFTQP